MFGPVVCPRDSRERFLKTLNLSRSRSRSLSFGSGITPAPPLPLPPPPSAAPPSSRGGDEPPRGGGEIKRRGSGGEGGRGEEESCPAAAEGGGAAAAAVAGSWGRLPSVGQMLSGFSSEKPGLLVEASAFSSERQGYCSTSQRPGLLRQMPDRDENDIQDFPDERGVEDGDGDEGGPGGRTEGGEVVGGGGDGDGDSGGRRISEEEEEEERRAESREEAAAEATAASVMATPWGGQRKEAGEQDFAFLHRLDCLTSVNTKHRRTVAASRFVCFYFSTAPASPRCLDLSDLSLACCPSYLPSPGVRLASGVCACASGLRWASPSNL